MYVPTRGLGQGQAITSTAGNVLLQAAPLTGPAAPFVAVAGAVTELLGAIGVGGGCGQSCITATSYANQAEVILKNNLATYEALPSPRAQSAQQAAENIFNQTWLGLQYSCAGVPGSAGQNCIKDRQRGGKFDWFKAYYDPIATDSNVAPDPLAAPSTSVISSLTSAVGGTPLAGLPSWAWLAAAALVLWMVIS